MFQRQSSVEIRGEPAAARPRWPVGVLARRAPQRAALSRAREELPFTRLATGHWPARRRPARAGTPASHRASRALVNDRNGSCQPAVSHTLRHRFVTHRSRMDTTSGSPGTDGICRRQNDDDLHACAPADGATRHTQLLSSISKGLTSERRARHSSQRHSSSAMPSVGLGFWPTISVTSDRDNRFAIFTSN